MSTAKTYRVIISGGGTGGHVYPALAIADQFKAMYPGSEIHFVGAEGKIEMEKVPLNGYTIDGLWISGFQRKNMAKNLLLPFKLISSFAKVNVILNRFKPDIAIGVGGYASGPLLYVAGLKGKPLLLQEQNSFPGVTNKLLAGKANKICVAYPGMEKFFAEEKIVFTGNPVRNFKAATSKAEAVKFFGLSADKPTVLIIGGSLGARTINQSILAGIDELRQSGLQVIWQTGKVYYDDISRQVKPDEQLKILPFIDRMDYAYAMADTIVSRAGAISISELALLKKPVILVPSPNVAEDHQTKNALALTEKHAAIMVRDAEAKEMLISELLRLSADKNKQEELSNNIAQFARPNAARDIVEEAVKLIEARRK